MGKLLDSIQQSRAEQQRRYCETQMNRVPNNPDVVARLQAEIDTLIDQRKLLFQSIRHELDDVYNFDNYSISGLRDCEAIIKAGQRQLKAYDVATQALEVAKFKV
jgi:hypothetical protein